MPIVVALLLVASLDQGRLRELRLGLAKNVDDSAVAIRLKIRTVYISGSKISPEGLAKLGK